MLIFSAAKIYLIQLEYSRIFVKENIDNVKELLEAKLRFDAELLGGLADSLLEAEQGLREAWLIKDRSALFNQALPFFDVMNSKYNVTHLYFIDLQGVCFLRMHDPANFGDTINRLTLKQAMSTGLSTYGIELGPLGMLTLRMVHPWYFDNGLKGYIEVGEEIRHIAPELKKILEVELIFIIDKSFIDRTKWKKGLTMIGRAGDWEYFRDFVIIDSTIGGGIIPEIGAYLKRFHKQHSETIFKIGLGDRIYLGGFTPLLDAGGRDIGDLVILKENAARHVKPFIHIFAVLASAYVAVGGIFFVYLSRIISSLTKVNG